MNNDNIILKMGSYRLCIENKESMTCFFLQIMNE